MSLREKFEISCKQLLSDQKPFCNICFNSNENSLTSYDGRKFYFKENISLIEDVFSLNECIS